MIKEDTYQIVTEKIEVGKTQCSLCSRLRRGIVYNAAVSLACNKIALGHHRDDLIETLMLNLFFAGSIRSMPPYLRSDDGRNVVIGPLAYASEEESGCFAELKNFLITPCDLCGSQENLQRKRMKELLRDMEREIPNVKSSIMNAMGNVRSSQLLDRTLTKQLKDFAPLNHSNHHHNDRQDQQDVNKSAHRVRSDQT